MRVAFDPCTERELFVLEVPDAGNLPTFCLPSARFVCLIIWDADKASDQNLAQVANWLLSHGAVYVCCWGESCERVHDAVDTADISRNPSCDPVVMTTCHDKEPLAEAVYYALNTAWPDEGYADGCESVVAVCIAKHDAAQTVRAAFTDPRGFSERICL